MPRLTDDTLRLPITGGASPSAMASTPASKLPTPPRTPCVFFDPVPVAAAGAVPTGACALALTVVGSDAGPDEPEHPLRATISATTAPIDKMRFTMAS